MTNKQLETSREIRQWLKIIIPAGTAIAYCTCKKFRVVVNNFVGKFSSKLN